MLKQRIEDDLKSAMLSGNAVVANTLKMIKSAILYKEVELGNRDSGLADDQVIDVLTKEAKKRQEASVMYSKAERLDQAAAEQAEYEIIAQYLPSQLSDEELSVVVSEVLSSNPGATAKDMGKIIGEVKAKVGASAEGSRVASLVKQKLS